MNEQLSKTLTEISKVTRTIEERYPELQKYLDETRSTLPQGDNSSASISNEALVDYLNGLKKMIAEYKENH